MRSGIIGQRGMLMSRDIESVEYLRDEQYANDANLSSRVDLHRKYSTNPQGWFHWVFDHLGLETSHESSATSLLELGCGEGGLWRENLTRIPEDLRLTLTDFSPGMLEAAESRLASRLPRARFRVVDAQSIPFEDGTFDIVIANHMLYHVPALDLALRQIRRILKPEGVFFAATNGSRHMIELDHLVRVRAPAAQTEKSSRFFDLENGMEQLSQVFGQVERDLYSDSLEVTDSLAVIRYLLSTPAKSLLTETRIRDLRRALDNQIVLAGSFHISKEAGLFTCTGRAAATEVESAASLRPPTT